MLRGHPEEDAMNERALIKFEEQNSFASENVPSDESVRIMIDIRMTNVIQIRQKNLSYERLRKLVESLFYP